MRDEFFWLGEINKATAVINADTGLLDKALAPGIARGIARVLADGGRPGTPRPNRVITFEPLLIAAAGPEATLLHAGRSSQDMHATFAAAMLREAVLALVARTAAAQAALVALAAANRETIVPNYTNGVAAQPNSYAHQLLGHAAGFARDADRLREAYARIDRCAMGATVLNGTSWPLDRERIAACLGFGAVADNAYDATQLSTMDAPLEAAQIVTALALRVGNFLEDLMPQYAQPRPWILLRPGAGTTYASSAMPQKRNPGIINDTRRAASNAIARAAGATLRMHNITPGMPDPRDNAEILGTIADADAVLAGFAAILSALDVDPARALEELDSDWTASQELADVLMRKYELPFRVGHHFASEIVDHAKRNDLKPRDFPYAEARRIYAEAVADDGAGLPMSEAEFRATLDPVAIVANRATRGGPQPAELDRMIAEAETRIGDAETWAAARRTHIDAALARLGAEFETLLKG